VADGISIEIKKFTGSFDQVRMEMIWMIADERG